MYWANSGPLPRTDRVTVVMRTALSASPPPTMSSSFLSGVGVRIDSTVLRDPREPEVERHSQAVWGTPAVEA
jgi:hypothetical protein